MKKFFKENYKFLLFLIVIGLIGGFFTGKYLLESYTEEVLEELANQLGNINILVLVSIIQVLSYTIVLGILGIIISKKIGLWKPLSFEKKPIISSVIVSVIGGLSMILFDVLIFSNFSEIIAQSYHTKPTINYFISSITYGGVTEEVIMRLFLMSLISLIIYKIFYKKENKIPTKVFVISNIIVALLFAMGHLPATALTLGITPIILIRCFLLNGGIGLLFGWLYRKYGIQYAMLAHIGCHIVSKVIWLIFL